MNLFFVFISALVVTLSASASFASNDFVTTDNSVNHWTRYQNYKIHLDVPKGWRIERDLFGMPITVLGPERHGERAVLSVQHTPVFGMHFDHQLLLKTKDQYYSGRHDWLTKFEDVKYLSDLPYRHLAWKNGNDGFEMGFRYHMRGINLEERSVQVNCGQRLYFVKTLTSNKIPAEDTAVLSRLVNQLNCVNTTPKDGVYEPGPLQDLAERFKESVHGSSWPTPDQIQKATVDQKVAMVSSVIDFYKSYEDATASDDSYAAADRPLKNDSMFASIKKRAEHLFSFISGDANADGQYDCFFAGWPSKLKNGSCEYPWDSNSNYPAKDKNTCGDGELACNPSLFGDGVCITVATGQEREHATLRCEDHFRASGKTFDDVVKSSTFNKDNLAETIDYTKSVCGSEPYKSANYGLCMTLKEKLEASIHANLATADDPTNAFLNGMDKVKPSEYDKPAIIAFANFNEWAKQCVNEKGEVSEDPACKDDHFLAMLDDLEKIQKDHQQVGKELTQAQLDADPLNNKVCDNCNKPIDPLATKTAIENTNAPKDEPISCTQEEIANKPSWGNCILTAINPLNSGKCAWNLITSLADSLIGTVKMLGQLIWKGLVLVKDGIVQSGKWIAGLFGYEDSSSEKANQAAQATDSFLDDLIHHPIDTVKALFKGIMDGVKEYMRTDAFCQEWDNPLGAHTFATCIKPANFDCLSCNDWFQGGCSVIGYAVGEIAPMILTGGGLAAAKGAGVGAKVLAFLGKAGKAGKMMKVEAEMTGELLKVTKAANNLNRVQRIVGGTENIIRKTIKVVRWPVDQVVKVTKAFVKVGTEMKGFAAGKMGTFEKTVTTLQKYRAANYVLRSGKWVAKSTIYVVKGTAKVGVGAVKVVGKAGIKSVKGVVSGIKSTVGLLTFPIRGPALAYDYIGTQAFKYGLKTGEKVFNKTLIKSAELTTAQNIDKYIAMSATLIKYPVIISNKVVARGELSTKNSFGIELPWPTDQEIHKKAVVAGKTDEEIRNILRNAHYDQKAEASILKDISEGKQPNQPALNSLATLRNQKPQDILDGIYTQAVIAKITSFSLGGVTPTFSDAEYQAQAKAMTATAGKEFTVDQAKSFIGDQITESKIVLGSAGREVTITQADIDAYALENDINPIQAKNDIFRKIEISKYMREKGIVNISKLPKEMQADATRLGVPEEKDDDTK